MDVQRSKMPDVDMVIVYRQTSNIRRTKSQN